ncbi:hypothetical protein H5410_004907 [Solanum commersonii]|uniref:Uncharacterized protein n=1 Tax=Solanum commersonii TaxID=4109 RepID=A0A9J6A558_SOLCO|nr:hypothetical protein H5410_004907 [Solanum commersonii]
MLKKCMGDLSLIILTEDIAISAKLREKVRKYSDKSKAIQLQNHFAKLVGEARSYFGDSRSTVHREYKGADKGRTRSLSESHRMLLGIKGFSSKVINPSRTWRLACKHRGQPC